MRIVKSASKHYSPLRYPGGKSSLAGFIASLIEDNNIKNCNYVEPYAGGAGAALTLLFLEKVESIVINDLDRAIYSFWKSVLQKTDEFVDRIYNATLTIEEWEKQRAVYYSRTAKQLDIGFAAFYLNRTNRSGIIEAGPIGGMNQTGEWGIDARFNKAGLIDRITNIASYKSRIVVSNQDGIELLQKVHRDKNTFVYLDPPYYAKGSSLYLNHYVQKNHTHLAEFLNRHNKFYWMLTYDNLNQIKELYKDRRQYEFGLFYHIDLPRTGKEVLILSDKIN
ncbi:MAG TPA: DNA adenine methylase [Chitinophagales bacterium]|nr:DNA adenine methylase [Chitinophagales bacterium]